MDRSWMVDAACRDTPNPDDWHPDTGGSVRSVMAICHAPCPVRDTCREYAMATEYPSHRYGVWGGTTPSERRQLHAERTAAANAAWEAAA